MLLRARGCCMALRAVYVLSANKLGRGWMMPLQLSGVFKVWTT
jgi:hypothetical protein